MDENPGGGALGARKGDRMVKVPNGAQRIIDLRMRGVVPDDLVIVSLVGPLPDGNPLILADGSDYDWRFLRGLRVCIFGRVGTPNRQTAIAIGRNLPERLWLWDVDAREGADVICHIRLNSLDKGFRNLAASDWSAFVWPWSEWENKQFEGNRK